MEPAAGKDGCVELDWMGRVGLDRWVVVWGWIDGWLCGVG